MYLCSFKYIFGGIFCLFCNRKVKYGGIMGENSFLKPKDSKNKGVKQAKRHYFYFDVNQSISIQENL